MRLDGNDDSKVYCVMGAGAMAEGQIWEAAMAAVNFKLDNLVGIVDRNRLQATGFVEERFNTNPLAEKWAGFGWAVLEIDGHDVDSLVTTLANIKGRKGPQLLHATTRKGAGYAKAEDDPILYHGVPKFDPVAGIMVKPAARPSYTQIFGDWLCDMARADKRDEAAARRRIARRSRR